MGGGKPREHANCGPEEGGEALARRPGHQIHDDARQKGYRRECDPARRPSRERQGDDAFPHHEAAEHEAEQGLGADPAAEGDEQQTEQGEKCTAPAEPPVVAGGQRVAFLCAVGGPGDGGRVARLELLVQIKLRTHFVGRVEPAAGRRTVQQFHLQVLRAVLQKPGHRQVAVIDRNDARAHGTAPVVRQRTCRGRQP